MKLHLLVLSIKKMELKVPGVAAHGVDGEVAGVVAASSVPLSGTLHQSASTVFILADAVVFTGNKSLEA